MDTETLIKIIASLVAAVGVYYAGRRVWHQDKASRQTRPTIAKINGYGSHFHLILTNNKPHPITIQNVTAKEKWLGSIFIKSVPLEWHPTTGYQPDYTNTIADAFKRFSAMPQYTVTTQRSVNVKLLKHVDGTIYKIYVTTTGGKCRSIYRSPLKPPGAKSNTQDKKQ